MWPCQLGISWSALFHATTTSLHLINQCLSYRLKCLALIHRPSLTFRFFSPVKALYVLRSIPSDAQFLHRTSIFHKFYPPHKWGDEYGADGYFRMEAGNLLMLQMTDSSQDKRGRTEGWSWKRSRIGTLFLEGQSVARWGSMTFVLICVEMNALDRCALEKGLQLETTI